jgi:hypothetical protein
MSTPWARLKKHIKKMMNNSDGGLIDGVFTVFWMRLAPQALRVGFDGKGMMFFMGTGHGGRCLPHARLRY